MVKNIYSKLDSNRFGYKIGKVDETFFSGSPLVYDGIRYFKDNNYDLIIARIKLNRPEIINGLTTHGFHMRDIQHTQCFDLHNTPMPNPSGKALVREYKSSDLNRIVELTRLCFNNYGHYFADDILSKSDCLDAYGDWAYNTCAKPNVADKIFVAEIDDNVVGYLSFKNGVSDNGYSYSAGGIGAVDPSYRNQEIFSDITKVALQWGFDEGMEWHEHNTLINNLPVNRVFTKIGFNPTNHVMTLHGWMK